MLRKLKIYFIRKVYEACSKDIRMLLRQDLPEFKNKPSNLFIDYPHRINNPQHINIGDDVSLGPGCLLSAITKYPSDGWHDSYSGHSITQQHFDPIIRIGNRVSATSNLTVAAMKEIIIEDDVMFASNINLTDGFHGYDNVDVPFKYQPIQKLESIMIERGCWIGQNVMVMPGVTIGKFTVIGANSVVTKDVPPNSIAFGAPARVVKRWDSLTSQWCPVDVTKT